MITTKDNNRLLQGYLASYGISLEESRCDLVLQHLDLLVEKNKVINLTRITEPEDAIIRHLVDSFLLLPTMESHGFDESTQFVDLGTGGGFPGIPLGIAIDAQGVLVDSVGKKVRAVNEFIAQLGLQDHLTAVTTRAEQLAKHDGGRYDFVVARAVADLSVLLEYAAPLLKMHGHMVITKSHISDEELEHGELTARIVGMNCVSRETYELPEEQGYREILAYERVAKSSVKLPRAVGAAKHNPLYEMNRRRR